MDLPAIDDSYLCGLRTSDIRRVTDYYHRLLEVSVFSSYLYQTADVLSNFVYGSAVYLYTRDSVNRIKDLVHTVFGDVTTGMAKKTVLSYAELNPMYTVQKDEKHANRVVNTRELYDSYLDRLDEYRQQVLLPLGLWYQMRSAFYCGGKFVGYCGFGRDRGYGEFTAYEEAMLSAILPAIRDRMAVYYYINNTSLFSKFVEQILDAIADPAFIVTDNGTPVYANSYARKLSLPLSTLSNSVPACSDLAHTTSFSVEGLALRLIVIRPKTFYEAAPLFGNSLLTQLPASLHRVAELMLEGLADKEISQRTGLSHQSVRTYVTRIYKKLGVHGRSDLFAHIIGRRN